ncbi:unnamed protein product [Clonostachys rosea f. rosea IK726]|uniref:Uncharacterized protein n=1 Tax=Clonostachys rosea f. rosea IK726 TaxID=1349383 RepID=A0ACA9TVQ9_BIOOC|nr:unnamed protein product [Clonostachys rosea f. rosea IK726]
MASFSLTEPNSRELSGGDLLAQSLSQAGVEVAFGLHGGHLDAFLVGCELAKIRLVDTRHETVAVQAAEAYAKFSSKIGVCFVTANSGQMMTGKSSFGNGLPGLATALADRSPILCITSSPPLRDNETNCLQGIIDQVVAAKPLTKLAVRVTNAEETPRLVSHAIRTALSGTPGPVLLDFPIDVLFSPVHKPLISWGSISSPLTYGPGVNTEAVKEARKILESSSRPVVIAGSGATSVSARNELAKFSKAYHVPVFDTLKYSVSTIPTDSSFSGGSADKLAYLQILGKKGPDLVLLLGARTGMFLGGRAGGIIPPDCKLIHVDVDGGEIGRVLPVALGAVSDCGQFLAAMNSINQESTSPSHVDEEWVKDVLSLRHLASPFEEAPPLQPSNRLHPYHALKSVFSSVEPGSIVILDGGEAGLWGADTLAACSPSAVVKSTGNLGFLGNGFGHALGAAIASPDRKVVSIQGDGSAGFHLMELDTYKRHGLNILTVVVNNYAWGMSLNGQDMVYGGDEPARPISSLSEGAEYDQVARALGNGSARLERIEDIPEVIRRLQGQTGPSAVNLIVDRSPTHPGTEAMVGDTKDPKKIVVPYYDNLPKITYSE